jgi:quercetin dioxygenase-like cupin family protein
MTMRLARIPWAEGGTPSADVLRGRLGDEGFEVFEWVDAPGADYAPHAHDRDESLWVVDGEITFGVAGAEYCLGPGDRLMLPHGTVHTARAGASGARYLIGERR